jgi:uncharacterized protein DUF2806
MTDDANLPSATDKPSLLEWFETFLPFHLPRIPLSRTAANLDKALASIVLAAGSNSVVRIQSSTRRIEARSSAETAFIRVGENEIAASHTSLRERAIEYAVGDAVRRQHNREDILNIAVEDLSRNPPQSEATQTIEDDWLDAFQRYAEQKSASDIQQLWGRILSSEIRQPGSTSLRTLSFLSTISNNEAVEIAAAFKFVVDKNIIPVTGAHNERQSFGELIKLQELGVITGLSALGGMSWEKPVHAAPGHEFPYATTILYQRKVGIIYFNETSGKVEIPSVSLTTVGRELYAITETVSPDYDFFESILKGIQAAGMQKTYIADITSLAGGQLLFTNLKQLLP